jgi:hypothetical protein
MSGHLGPYALGPDAPNQGVYTGDSKRLAEEIPSSSVHMVFTDPIYWEIGDYAWAAQLAERILVPGGHLILQTVSDYRFDCEAAIRATTTLTPRPLLAETLSACAPMFKHKAFQSWKPHLWFSKGEGRDGGWVRDSHSGGGVSKSHHVWQDHPRFYSIYISRLTNPGDIVVDPFIGGGTTGVACKQIGRRWLGFELEEERATKARARIGAVPVPLLAYSEEQMEMWPAEEEMGMEAAA